MNKRKQTWKAAVSAAAIAASAAIPMAANASSITIDSVTQRWPWNNKVDITYTVSGGQDVAAGVFAKIVFTATIAGQTYTIDGVHDIGANASNGTHTVTWTPPADIRAKATDCTMTATLSAADNPSGDDYMVVELSGDNKGRISYEGLLATQSASDERYNTDEYKTTKLVLRKVPRWADRGVLPNAAKLSAMTGYPTGYSGDSTVTANSPAKWPTARDYYIGVFPVTQTQYQTITGSNPSKFTTAVEGNVVGHRPVEKVSWNTLRDSTAVTASITPSATGGFFARINHATSRNFDLPTEVMFEIAQRAGSTDVYSWGPDPSEDYIVSSENSGGSTVAVGSRLPNDWGLFDTAGNVREWCLDANGSNSSTPTPNLNSRTDAFTPYTANNRTYRMYRGGGAYAYPVLSGKTSERSKASYRDGNIATTVLDTLGFRVALIAD